jgi:uncharacterized protein YbjT (DUF2867 family)
MQSIVLGGSGIVGGHIVAKLIMAGEHPIAISRSPPADERAVRWVQGDLARPESLQLPRITTVYCTAHSLLLAKALPSLFSDELRRVVLFTSTSIVTKLNSDIPAEREGLQRLAEGEQQTIDMCTRMGVGWTVLRPTMIYDEGRDANVSRLARLIQKVGVMPLAGRGAGLRQPVHAEDLAIGALNAASREAARDKIYALPGPRSVIARWSAAFSTDSASVGASLRCRPCCGGLHLRWRRRYCRMPMRRWASVWRRTWCSMPRPRSGILVGARAAFIRSLSGYSGFRRWLRSPSWIFAGSLNQLGLTPS